MFTGIVEEVGTIEQITRGAHSAVLTIRARKVLTGTGTGDSISVNGVCLTVTEILPGCFSADIMHETLDRSSLKQLSRGSHVNLERAMPADGRFGGHIVAGHVDGVGKIVRIQRDDTAVWYTVQAEPEIMRYIVEKGSVAVDGISLTVAGVSQKDFSVSAIPHTVSHTVLRERSGGSLVNLETDIIGKYVEKLLCPAAAAPQKNSITKDFICAAEFATTANINFMATHGRGLICMPMSEKYVKKLKLPQMVQQNTDNHETAFTVSIDHVTTSTGISAEERSVTALRCVSDDAGPEDFRRPGHMFPLLARPDGVLERGGHTEATVDLCRLAGLKECGLCCEIMREDGTMMRTPELKDLAKKWNLKFITIHDLKNYRKCHDRLVDHVTTVKMSTKYEDFRLTVL